MSSGEELTYRKKSDIKFVLDVVFLIVLLILIISISIKNLWEPGVIAGVSLLFVIYIGQYIWTREWLLGELRKNISEKDKRTINSAQKILDLTVTQKNAIVKYEDSYNQAANNIGKMKSLAFALKQNAKEILYKVSQSLQNTDIEQKPVQANIDKMMVLKQRIQIIAELILELSEYIQQIGSIIGLVEDIAEQTNMLALNAAVEAARAGEHGKGFAVVAGEIRKLADESKQAITKISSLTNNIQCTTNSTVMATEEGSKEIESVVKDINIVSSNSETLLNLIKEILESLDVLNQNAKKQSDIIERLNSIDEENSQIAENLSQTMSANSERISKLNSLSYEMKSSAIEG